MPMINFSEPLPLLTAVLLFVLVLWFAKQSKKSIITGIMLFVFVSMLIGHTLEFTIGNPPADVISTISYLWIDDIEAKAKKKKSIDNSLDWFWSKV